MFDQMDELNLKYYKELTMYILAGKRKLADVQANELPALKAKAEQTGAQEDAQLTTISCRCATGLKKAPRSGTHPDDLRTDGPPDPAAAKQRYADGGENPVLPW